jgi:K+-transporting ATPase KdpF subunit
MSALYWVSALLTAGLFAYLPYALFNWRGYAQRCVGVLAAPTMYRHSSLASGLSI